MLRVGIVGGGGMGGTHARQYRKMAGVELAIFDRDNDRAQSFSRQHEAKPHKSLADLIAASDIVDICLPTDLHLEACLSAIAAGKAFFVEKPLTRSLAQARELIDAATSAGVPAGVGHVVRFFPEYARANRLVKSGAIGTPAAVRLRRGGPAPAGSGDWFMDHERSGGVLLDLAIHDFDWIRWTIGEVKQVYSRSVAVQRGAGPDYALTTLTLDNGCVAHVESTWMDPAGFRTTFEVAGSKGLIDHDSRSSGSLVVSVANDGAQKSMPVRSTTESPIAPDEDPYYLELKGFLDAFDSGAEVPVSLEEGLKALQISVAAIESARTGSVINLQP